MMGIRIFVGIVARLVFWVMVILIVGNAVAHLVSEGSIIGAFFAVVLLPLTVLIYPFVSPEGASAWPMAGGSSLIPLLVVAVIAYPISTFIGGLDPT